MYGYSLYHAYLILTKFSKQICPDKWQLACQQAHQPNLTPGRWSVPCITNYFYLYFVYFYYCLIYLLFFYANNKRFKPNIRVIHVRDLNFVHQSEIFVNFDGLLQASHLILGCTLVYSTWQPFEQALLVDSPLLSYIDIRHPNFLPPNLTVGEARDLGPRWVRVESLVLVREASAASVFQGCAVH